MRTTRLLIPWSAVVLFSGATAGCAASASKASDGLRVTEASLVQTTPDERRQMRDSARAQEVADEVGPRVTVSADFDYGAGSRRVDADFHMYDDAYVIVGHLDASGRLKIVFPSAPGDDGFVRGNKIYHIPSFFAGFADEYAWRYSDYRYRAHTVASRMDSYDAGLGYVFVIASWRPMRLDRISDGSRWTTYDVSDISYMQDPREAIEELGSLIAGDNREAYTIEYAHYTTTNYGTYSLASFDAINNRDCYGYSSFGLFFFNPVSFLPKYGFGFGPVSCYDYNKGYYGYGYFGYPIFAAPPIGPRGRPTVPIGSPIFHFPRSGATGTVAVHRPRADEASPPTPGGNANAAIDNGASSYRRPGLIAEDAGGPQVRGQGRVTGSEMGINSRPTIQQMIGSRRIDQEARGMGLRDAGIRDAGSRDNGSSSMNRGGVNVTRGSDAARESGRTFNGGSHANTPPSRSAPARMEPSHSAPRGEATHAAPAHSEPARSAPASSSSGSSGSSKKP